MVPIKRQIKKVWSGARASGRAALGGRGARRAQDGRCPPPSVTPAGNAEPAARAQPPRLPAARPTKAAWMIRDLSKMYPQTRHPAPHQPAQPFKFTISESCDRIKEEFQFLQAQYHSLKLECEKLASEKTEMQRHYVMYYEMSYGLNIEMHKQVS
ncbi:hypothetical protein U0070_020830 [Myodes glareolus]|uniref:Groucho/TLE N-terminal Q-rich domain-containing protein n=1 Tax=Myodes glareolus TaxID=447135 RepID=A0AAW0IP86_MYOGA